MNCKLYDDIIICIGEVLYLHVDNEYDDLPNSNKIVSVTILELVLNRI